MSLNKKYIRLFFSLILLAACSADVNDASINISGYDYAHMKEFILAHPLKEISGIAYRADSNSFVAINDEKGNVYVLDGKTFQIMDKYPFGDDGDYEEIQVAGGFIYVLRSDGTIYKMKLNGRDMPYVITFDYSGPKAEFESFYIDVPANTIVLIPKHSKEGAKAKQTVTYTINNSNGAYAQKKEYVLSWSDLSRSSTLHPSAVAVHPISKDIYLLASIEKRLIVLNADWKLLAEYELDRNHFQQPEGITFDSAGNLYITNEAGEKSPTVVQIPILSK